MSELEVSLPKLRRRSYQAGAFPLVTVDGSFEGMKIRSVAVSSFVGAVAAASVFVVPSVGGAAESAKKAAKPRVITIEMAPLAYKPNVVRVAANESVQFKFVNKTIAPHEALIGDTAAQVKHAKEMKAKAMADGDSMDMSHSAHNSKEFVLIKANSTATLNYKFGKAGRTMIGCHQPGHWEGGMKITVLVQEKSVG
jgi:uncharacterized cupredoxin-like copper-binding protein